jgi:hypothetical protein
VCSQAHRQHRTTGTGVILGCLFVAAGPATAPGRACSPTALPACEAARSNTKRSTAHVFRAYWKRAFLKQYEKFSTYLRNEICSNNLANFRLTKNLDNLPAVREKFLEITDRFAGFQAECLNVHVDFPLLQRIALPLQHGSAKIPGIKIHDTRMIRLFEVLLHGGTHITGWSTQQIHEAALATFDLSSDRYSLNQLRLRSPQVKSSRSHPARRQTLCLPSLRQGCFRRPALPLLPQATLRTPC